LIRFDAVYSWPFNAISGEINRFTRICIGNLRDLYQIDASPITVVNFDHIKRHYYFNS